MAQLKQTFILRLRQCISLLMFLSSIRSRFCNSDCLNALIVNCLAFAYIFHNSLRIFIIISHNSSQRNFKGLLWLHDNVKQDLVINIQWYQKYMQSEQQKGIFLLVSNWQCSKNFWCEESHIWQYWEDISEHTKNNKVFGFGGGDYALAEMYFREALCFLHAQ